MVSTETVAAAMGAGQYAQPLGMRASSSVL